MIGTGPSIQLMRLFGIRIGASPSWFVVLFVFIYFLSDRFEAVLGRQTLAYALAVAAALLFFGSLILHELAMRSRRAGRASRPPASISGSSAGSRGSAGTPPHRGRSSAWRPRARR